VIVSFSIVLQPLFHDHAQIFPWYRRGWHRDIGIFEFAQACISGQRPSFLLHCRTIDQYGQRFSPFGNYRRQKLTEARWQKVTRGTYSVFFILLWIAGVLSFYVRARRSERIAVQRHPDAAAHRSQEYGYVTPAEKQRIDYCKWYRGVGFPSLILGGSSCTSLSGSKLFPNAQRWPSTCGRNTH